MRSVLDHHTELLSVVGRSMTIMMKSSDIMSLSHVHCTVI